MAADAPGAVRPSPGGADAQAAFERLFGTRPAMRAGVALACARRLLSDDAAVAGLLAPAIARLAGDPLFVPAWRVSRDAVRQTAVLHDAPCARMAASVIAARALDEAAPAGLVLSGHVTVTRYHRAGDVCIRRWRRRPGDGRLVEVTPLSPGDGAVVVLDGRREAHVLARAARDVVTLGIVLCDAARPLIREYDPGDGRERRRAASDNALARRLLLLTMLRIMRRGEAGDVFAEATRDPAHHARWSAMREWLALDARAAWPRLRAMAAADPHPDVRRAAAATLARARARAGAGAAACRA